MINPDSRQASSGFEQTSFLPKPDFNPIYPTSFDLSAPSPECPTRTISRYFLPPKVIQAVFGGAHD